MIYFIYIFQVVQPNATKSPQAAPWERNDVHHKVNFFSNLLTGNYTVTGFRLF